MKHNLTANSLQSNDDSNVSARSELERDEIVSIDDISYETLITKRQYLSGIPNIVPPYDFTLDTTKPSVYTLTSPQLAAVNDFTRYPAFVALISGRQANDILPTYTGSPGSFTQIDIQLHDDGGGLNADTTLVQFS